MELDKYIGIDAHRSTLVVNARDCFGKVVLESVVPTKADAILQCIGGLKGRLHVTFEEGTHAQWLYEILRNRADDVVVCDARESRLLQDGDKGDSIDAGKLSHLLRMGAVKAVYHGRHGTATLKELVRSYDALVQDSVRVMNRLKAVYRSRAISSEGPSAYQPEQRESFLNQLSEPGARRRAEMLYEELDGLMELRRKAERSMVTEARRHCAYSLLRSVPQLGPVRIARLIAIVDTPHRFPNKAAFWNYCGFAVVTHNSAEREFINGKLVRSKRAVATRGLNPDHNPRMKELFKSVAIKARHRGPFKEYFEQLIAKGTKPELATITLARKISAVTLAVWKKGEPFESKKLNIALDKQAD
jgi:transposase